MSSADDKKTIIDEYKVHPADTGSPEVQIALLTRRIAKLMGHLKIHRQDNHSRRGLLGLVGKRRRLLYHLAKRSEDRYKTIVGKLSLSK